MTTPGRVHPPANRSADQHRVILGDALTVMQGMPDSTVDAVVTDPPYAINAAANDSDVQQLMCSPMLGMQSANWHEKATHSRGYADNDPRAFQRWCEAWLDECHRVLKPGGHLVAFGGTRTAHRLVTAAEDVNFEIRDSLAWIYSSGVPKGLDVSAALRASGDHVSADRWSGWNTALKPGHEPILLARKALEGTVADNITCYGTGALNLSACRLNVPGSGVHARTKWATNVHLDAGAADRLGTTSRTAMDTAFFVSKPTQSERVTTHGIAHPTVKPLDLMRHLVRLVTPPGGVVLDPFAGSGTMAEAALLEGCSPIVIEREPNYIALIQERIRRTLTPFVASADEPELTLPY